MTDYEKYLSHTGRELHESAIRRMGTVVARAGDLVSFAPGYPDATMFPWAELHEISAQLLTGSDGSTLQYGPTRGYQPLLDAIVGLLGERGIRAGIEQLLITTGSQQGIDLAGRVLVSPGEVVLVELPSFTGAIAAFKNVQADVVGVRQEHDGIDLDDLDRVWQRETNAGKTVKLLYLVPNFQNPTGVLTSLEKRRAIVAWAEQRDVLIVEDDPYGSLYFEDVATSAETRPLRADDPSGRVIYLSTFSKTLAPGLRVGWMVAPAALVDRFETAKQSGDLASGSLDQRIACEAMRRGVVDRLVPTLRASYRARRDVLMASLTERLGGRMSWVVPHGGFFLWATLPEGEQDDALLERALEERLIFVSGSAFFVDGSGHDTIRLAFSAAAESQIDEGVARLARAITAGVRA